MVRDGGRPVLVGISGFGGAGKSTLAEALHRSLPGSAVVPGDEFMRERPSAARSDDWSSVDRSRLVEQVLRPISLGQEASYQIYDWDAEALGRWVPVRATSAVIVEGVGLFHPELIPAFDLRVWIDVDLDTATARGIQRDTVVYSNPQTDLWERVWKPNDEEFFRRFSPDRAADLLYTGTSDPAGGT